MSSSTASGLPDPLVPAEVDITGLDGFMLNIQRLFASELWAISTGDEFKAAVALWGRAWQQSPPGSIPNDDRVLAAFSAAGKNWKKVRDVALRGFVECSDGRLYHRVLCEDVMTAHRKRLAFIARTKNASEARRNRNGDRNEQRDEAFDSDRNDDRDEDRDVPRNDDRDDGATNDVTSVHRRRRRQDSSSLRSEDNPPSASSKPQAPSGANPTGAPDMGRSDSAGAVRGERPPKDSRLPPDWQPDVDDRAFAIGEGFGDRDVDRIGDGFRDYWLAKAGADAKKADWHATWRNWVRNEGKRSNGSGPRSPPGSSQQPSRAMRGVASALAGLDSVFNRTDDR